MNIRGTRRIQNSQILRFLFNRQLGYHSQHPRLVPLTRNHPNDTKIAFHSSPSAQIFQFCCHHHHRQLHLRALITGANSFSTTTDSQTSQQSTKGSSTVNDGSPMSTAGSVSEQLERIDRVVLPDDGHKHVAISEWYKLEGNEVHMNEKLCEIDTPDYAYDLQAKVSGYLLKILKPAGANKVTPGEAIALITSVKPAIEVPKHVPATEAKLENVKSAEKEEKSGKVGNGGIKMESVNDFLESVNPKYVKYTKVLVDDGFDSVQELLGIKEEDLQRLNIKTGHARVILEELQKIAAANKTNTKK